MKLKPHIEAVEIQYIEPALGVDLFAKVKADNAADKYLELKNKLPRAIAHLAMADGALTLPLNFTASGVYVITKSDGNTSTRSSGNNATSSENQQHRQYISQQHNKGLAALGTIKQWIIDNTEDFEEFTSEEEENNNPNLTIHDNTDKKSFMV